MTDWTSLLVNLPTSVALALIFSRVLKTSLTYHVRSLKEQREDLLSHMKSVCGRQGPPPAAVLALVCLMLMIGGCAAGQGGVVGDFNLTTPLGSLVFKTWSVEPVKFSPATQPVAP